MDVVKTGDDLTAAFVGLKVGVPAGVRPVLDEPYDRQKWDALEWDVMDVRKGRPPPGPKPTWEDLQRGFKIYEVMYNTPDNYNYDYNRPELPIDWKIPGIQKRLTDEKPIQAGEHALDIGDGIDHFTSVAIMLEHANTAGAVMPFVGLTRSDRTLHPIHTNAVAREVVEAVAMRENAVISASALIRQKLNDLIEFARVEENDLDERYKASLEAQDITANVEEHMRKAAADFDPNRLPTDVDALKPVLQERLEAAATRKVADLKSAATQHGIDLPASCTDEENALKAVARQRALGSIRLDMAETAEKATAEFAKWEKRINAITALNTPQWNIQQKAYEANPDSAVDVLANTIVVEAEQPSGVLGGVTWGKIGARDSNGDQAELIVSPLTASHKNNIRAAISPKNLKAGEVLTVTIRARNLCGKSTVVVKQTLV